MTLNQIRALNVNKKAFLEVMSIMKHFEGNFSTFDGLNLYYQAWLPNGDPKAVIQLSHGVGEHSSRYSNVVNALVPAGFAIYTKDYRGHGKSEGEHAYVNSFTDWVNDEKEFTKVVRRHEENVPLFLLGHSLGACIAILYAASQPDDLTGLVLSGTGTHVGDTVNPILVFLARFLAKIRPKWKTYAGLPDHLSRDPDVVEKYINDPLVFTRYTFRLGNEIFRIWKILSSEISLIKIPILVQSGELDKIVTGVSELFSQVTAEDKTLKIYKGLFHEVYNELEADRVQVLANLKDWLINHL